MYRGDGMTGTQNLGVPLESRAYVAHSSITQAFTGRCVQFRKKPLRVSTRLICTAALYEIYALIYKLFVFKEALEGLR